MDTDAHLITVSAAADAAGLTVRVLREYLSRGALPLLTPQARFGAWNRLCPADVLRLAVLGRLTLHGFTVSESAGVIVSHLDPRLANIAAAAGLIAWPLLRARLAGELLHVSREADGTIAATLSPFHGHRPSVHRAPAVLVVNVSALAATAADRVRNHPGTTANTGRPVRRAEAMERTP